MTPEQIAAIAKGLTEAQRRGLVHARSPDFGSGRGLWATGRSATLKALACKGLVRNGSVITPTGLAVRAYEMERAA